MGEDRSMSVNLVFMGNSEFGIPLLEKLARHSEYRPIAVVTNPPKPMGRGRSPSDTPIGNAARELGLERLQPISLKDAAFSKQLTELNPDLFIVVAYKILPEDILRIPRIGALNLHASLLPEYRGAAPIQRALMDGKRKTGLTTFLIEPQVDTGAILLSREIQLDNRMNYGELSALMSKLGKDLVIDTIDGLLNGAIKPVIQDHLKATSACKISASELEIHWEKKAEQIHNQIRALSPVPGAYTILGRKRYKIYRAAVTEDDQSPLEPGVIRKTRDLLLVGTGKGLISVLEIQREGGKKMSVGEFIRGFSVPEGARFGSDG